MGGSGTGDELWEGLVSTSIALVILDMWFSERWRSVLKGRNVVVGDLVMPSH